MNNIRLTHIDGLRTVAVLLVFFYHTDLLPGGYLGVDIFLVISGYIITKIFLSKNLQFNIIEIYNFFLRRVNRLLPPLIIVIIFTFLISYLLLLPDEIIFLSKTINYSLVFLTNIFFYFNTNYFSEVSNSPLLHFWSIGLEFQFYIFVVFFFLIFKKNIKFCFLILILSLILAQFGGNLTYNYPYIEKKINFFSPIFGSFYLLPTRLFEFCFGIIIALSPNFPKLNKFFFNNYLSYLCLLLLFFTIFISDNTTPHPSFVTFLICICTSQLILNNDKKIYLYKFLNYKHVSKFGLISYGFYLWHYPIIYYYKSYTVRNLELFEIFIVFLFALFFSLISYLYLEKPFRSKTNNFKKILFYVFVLLFFVALSFNIKTNKGYIERFNKEDRSLFTNLEKREKFLRNCRGRDIEKACIYGDKENITSIAWGDSHLHQLSPVLKKIFENQNEGLVEATIPGCLPIINTYRKDKHGQDCSKKNKKIFEEILLNKNLKKIIIHAFWSNYLNDEIIISELENFDLGQIFINQLNELEKAGKERYLILGVPSYDVDLKKYYFRKKLLNIDFNGNNKYLVKKKSQHDEDNKKFTSIIDSIQIENLNIYNPGIILCPNNICNAVYENELIYRDESHFAKFKTDIFINELKKFIFKN